MATYCSAVQALSAFAFPVVLSRVLSLQHGLLLFNSLRLLTVILLLFASVSFIICLNKFTKCCHSLEKERTEDS